MLYHSAAWKTASGFFQTSLALIQASSTSCQNTSSIQTGSHSLRQDTFEGSRYSRVKMCMSRLCTIDYRRCLWHDPAACGRLKAYPAHHVPLSASCNPPSKGGERFNRRRQNMQPDRPCQASNVSSSARTYNGSLRVWLRLHQTVFDIW